MINKIDKKTRIKLKFSYDALGTAICLQKKRWYGWKTISWTYPSTWNKEDSCDEILRYLWFKAGIMSDSEKELGEILMSKCKDTF